jgi:hypothetical protein
MRAVVVYESMYGNTHLVADAIGAGLEGAFDVWVGPVSQADPAVLDGAALVVAGGPTHVHGMSREATRKAAAEAADKPASPLNLEPDAGGPRAARVVRLAGPLPGQSGRLRHPDACARRADGPGIEGGGPAAPRTRF